MAMSGIMNFLSIAVKDRDLERNALSLLSIFLCRDFPYIRRRDRSLFIPIIFRSISRGRTDLKVLLDIVLIIIIIIT